MASQVSLVLKIDAMEPGSFFFFFGAFRITSFGQMVKPKWLSNLTQAKVEWDAQGIEKRQKRDEARGVVVAVTSWNHGYLSLSSSWFSSLSCLGWLWSSGKFCTGVDDTLWYGHLLTTGMGIGSRQRWDEWTTSPSSQAAQFTVSAAFASRVAVPSMAFTLHLGSVGNFNLWQTNQVLGHAHVFL